MNKLLTVALGFALSATALTSSAQKAYTEGVATYDMGGMADARVSFRGDSSVMNLQQGPATVKAISFKDEYFAMAMSIPAMSFKKAAVATPGEIEETTLKLPNFTFTPSTETKNIAGFNCKKVVAKDAAKNITLDVWVTTDISAPISAGSGHNLYAKAGGFPVQYTVSQMGRNVVFTLKSITDEKVPAGTFALPKDYERVSMTDLFSGLMGGRR